MAKAKLPDPLDDRPQTNPLLFFRTNLAGIGWFLYEAIRNCFLHGKAREVVINIEKIRPTDPEPELQIIDDGLGIAQEGRWRMVRLGYSDTGNGTGVRETAMTLAQMLEVHTVSADEPTRAWRIRLPLVQFFLEVQRDQFRLDWEEVPREDSRLPPGYRHGTMVILSDFRTPSSRNVRELRGTLTQITEENIRSRIPQVFPPDEASRCTVNGKRIPRKPFEGFLLWKEPPADKPGLGVVSGEVRLAETASGSWLLIGGTTATVPFPKFIEGMRVHNPELARGISRLFFDKRLTGIIRMGVLEQFPTRDRENLLAEFYVSAEARMVTDELARIAERMTERLRDYEAQPRSHVTQGLIAELVARAHEAQGIKPGSAPSGQTQAAGTPGAVPTAPPPPLVVSPSRLNLEPWDGRNERDTVTVVVKNSLPGETFSWEDPEHVGLVAKIDGVLTTIQSVRRQGVYLLIVQSRLHETRNATISVAVRPAEEPVPGPQVFSLIPMSTSVEEGQERVIRVRSEADTSGDYEWQVEPEKRDGERIARVTVQPGGREARFVGYESGRYVVTCLDRRDPTKTARSRIEVRARVVDDTGGPTACPPGGLPGGDVLVTTPGGTGSAEEPRPSPVTESLLHYRHAGTEWVFRISADPTITDTFHVEPVNRRIFIGDAGLSRFDEGEAQRRHVVACTAEGVTAIFHHEDVIAAEDYASVAQITSEVLDLMMPRTKKAENGKK